MYVYSSTETSEKQQNTRKTPWYFETRENLKKWTSHHYKERGISGLLSAINRVRRAYSVKHLVSHCYAVAKELTGYDSYTLSALGRVKSVLDDSSLDPETKRHRCDMATRHLQVTDPVNYDRFWQRILAALAQQPDAPAIPENTSYDELSPIAYPGHVKVDVRVCGMAHDLGETSEVKLYFILHTLTTAQGGSGIVSTQDLFNYIEAHDLNSVSQIYRTLQRGHDLNYWTWNKALKRVRITGLKRLVESLSYRIDETRLPDYLNEDAPGGRAVWIPVSRSNERFIAHVFTGWLALRDNRTIANANMAKIWNVSERTIRTWKGIADVQHTVNFAQSSTLESNIPEHAHKGKNGYIWRIANTYHAPGTVKRHDASGNAHKIRQVVNRVLWFRGLNPDPNGVVGEMNVLYFTPTKKQTAIQRATKHANKYSPDFENLQYGLHTVKTNEHGRLGLWSVTNSEVFSA